MEVKILFIADVIGEPGMRIFEKAMPYLKLKYSPEFIIVNGENTRNGKGLSEGLANKYFSLGVDVITSGNHIWDYSNFHKTLTNPRYSNILRPLNYPEGVPGRGYCIKDSSLGKKIAVVNIQGRTFMQAIDCPFMKMKDIVGKLKSQADIIFVDFHAEATAEKIAMGRFLDGQVSAVVGTHTHVQTADEEIFPKGTAFISDVGMTGPFDSVLGMKTEVALSRFKYQTPFRYETATDDLRLNGVIITADSETGKSTHIERIYLRENELYQK
ncbi:MAG: TIGR00282 family metallophosphoesterase [Candidatus Delongbacteria bacterium]|jgi:metallophosphoesterase (TIGR00282 family)|nr:TIGR00282 family metallophosphoesterase [Candidatus Delongbacteria bacterium]